MSEKTKIKDALAVLGEAAANMGMVVTTLDRNDLPTLLRAYKEVHESRQELEAISKIINTAYSALGEEIIPNAFEENEIDAIKLVGRNFYLTTRLNASIPADKRTAGHAWLRDVAKLPELIIERVDSKSLSSAIEAYFEEHAKLPPEEAISVHMKKRIGIRKA